MEGHSGQDRESGQNLQVLCLKAVKLLIILLQEVELNQLREKNLLLLRVFPVIQVKILDYLLISNP
jgi:hypothetical protein